MVLQLLYDNKLYAKMSKCRFECVQVDYLGHIISEGGTVVDPKKIEAVSKWPLPSNPKALTGFLGLRGYYRKFIKEYGGIAAPLNALLKKGTRQWNEEATAAF